jgi:integrase
VFPINADPELAEVFRQQREYTREVERELGAILPLVFHNRGRPIVNYYKAWHAACRRAGLAGRIPHDFRRSACRRLIQGGVPEQVAMKLTGWKSRAMLDRYFVFNERDLNEAVAKVATLRTAALAEPRTVVPLRAAEA